MAYYSSPSSAETTGLNARQIPLTAASHAISLLHDFLKEEKGKIVSLLVQYLKRRKRLIMRPQIHQEGSFCVEDVKTSEVISIPKVEIGPAELPALQEELVALLNQHSEDQE